jgi:uncharacterized protein
LQVLIGLFTLQEASENWSDEKKKSIRESRVTGTRNLVAALAKTNNPPDVFLSASATGYYGSRGDEILTESSPAGDGFLPEVCQSWEQEAESATDFGARVVTPRIGIVLSKEGGALEKMITPFKLGVGGRIGSGRQWMSWIALDDLLRAIEFSLEDKSVSGAFNATAPNPATNVDFTTALAGELHRPSIIPVPAFAIKLMFGEMGETLLLGGTRVIPEKLTKMGFKFNFEDLSGAIRQALI